MMKLDRDHGGLIVEEVMICLLQGSMNCFLSYLCHYYSWDNTRLDTMGEELLPPTQTVDATDDSGN